MRQIFFPCSPETILLSPGGGDTIDDVTERALSRPSDGDDQQVAPVCIILCVIPTLFLINCDN